MKKASEFTHSDAKMKIKKTFAPQRVNLSICDSQRCGESPDTAENSHLELCDRLLQNRVVTGWEKLFVSTLRRSRNPGRKQLAKLEAIASRLGYSVVDERGEV
jgi:hypothetical protein